MNRHNLHTHLDKADDPKTMAGPLLTGLSNAYDAGLSFGVEAPLRGVPLEEGPNLGDCFCLVRFICKHCSG